MKTRPLLASLAAAALALGSNRLPAQSAPQAVATPSDQVVQMSAFEITTTPGHGYVATNTAEGFKTNSSLLDIPQIDTVVTNDLIADINIENMSSTLQYFGVTSSYEDDSGRLRGGYGTTQLYDDEFPIHAGWTDNGENRHGGADQGGRAEGLYMLNSGLGGIILRTMKKPLPYNWARFSFSVDEMGLWKATIDTTGPIGKIGDVDIGYRFIAAYQQGHSYFSNMVDNRKILYPYFQARYQGTTVRFHVEVNDVIGSNTGMEVLTPTGELYTGAGRRISNQPPGNMQRNPEIVWEASVLQKFSSNWEMRLSGMYFKSGYWGGQVTTTGTSWNPGPDIYYVNRIDRFNWNYWTMLNDITGKYELGPDNWKIKNSDIWGWAFTSQITQKYLYSNSTYHFSDASQGIPLLPGQSSTSFAVPANSAAAINAIVVPPISSYTPSGDGRQAAHTRRSWNGGIYWEHVIEVVPQWFDVTAGWSWVNVTSDTVADVSQYPWQPTDLHYDQYVHRVGGTLHLGREASLYALNSTSFSPSSTVTQQLNGQQTPPTGGTDDEVGLKTAFLGGRISTDFAFFKLLTTNVAVKAGVFPNGNSYYNVIGNATGEGVDGDVALTVLPGWQLIGSFFSGHDRDQNNTPISGTNDNSWGLFTRYADFQKDSPLHGLSIGLGAGPDRRAVDFQRWQRHQRQRLPDAHGAADGGDQGPGRHEYVGLGQVCLQQAPGGRGLFGQYAELRLSAAGADRRRGRSEPPANVQLPHRLHVLNAAVR